MSTSRCRPAAAFRSQDRPDPDVRIHTLCDLAAGDTVLFASAPSGHHAGPRLTRRLLRALGQRDPYWRTANVTRALTFHKTPLGRPYVLLAGQKGPSVSFSHGGGRLWAALVAQEQVGIDVAYPQEFAGAYPFSRAFGPQELDCVRDVAGQDTTRAAALIWSLKEAAVKTIGTGFNTHDPREVRVGNPRRRQQGIVFNVWVGEAVTAWARPEGKGWLAVAVSQRITER